jgi:putative ATP-binding cassette transporter
MGSASKSFTALAAMQLAQEKRIDLDSPLMNYLPWFKSKWGSDEPEITVRQLMNCPR